MPACPDAASGPRRAGRAGGGRNQRLRRPEELASQTDGMGAQQSRGNLDDRSRLGRRR